MINERIKHLRKINNKTRKEVAKYLNISYSSYSNYENNERTINIDIINKLADYYNVSTDYIFEKTEYPLPTNEIEFLKDDNLTIEELIKKYKFNYDGIELTTEEIEALLELIKKLKK